MISTREEILQILRDNKERFAEKYGVTKLGLFGSFARNHRYHKDLLACKRSFLKFAVTSCDTTL